MITPHAAAAKVARESRSGDARALRSARQELAFVKLSKAIDTDRDNGIYLTTKQVNYLIRQLRGTLDE